MKKIIINKFSILFVLLSLLLINIKCAGTLGSFEIHRFPVEKKVLVEAIDSVFQHNPSYAIPEKWKSYDHWSKSGYDFLESKVFYFSTSPEEMYYVSFNKEEDQYGVKSNISIRSVFISDEKRWHEEKDFKDDEIKRIEKRFNDEIISKLEKYTHTKSSIESKY